MLITITDTKGNSRVVDTQKFKKNGITLGRSADCDIVIPDSNVSRMHAALVIDNGSWYIQDMNSTNGLIYNGKKIKTAVISDFSKVNIPDKYSNGVNICFSGLNSFVDQDAINKLKGMMGETTIEQQRKDYIQTGTATLSSDFLSADIDYNVNQPNNSEEVKKKESQILKFEESGVLRGEQLEMAPPQQNSSVLRQNEQYVSASPQQNSHYGSSQEQQNLDYRMSMSEFMNQPALQSLRKNIIIESVIAYFLSAVIILLAATGVTNIYGIIDALIILGSTLGVHLGKSRVAAIIMTVYGAINFIMYMAANGKFGGWLYLILGISFISITFKINKIWENYKTTGQIAV